MRERDSERAWDREPWSKIKRERPNIKRLGKKRIINIKAKNTNWNTDLRSLLLQKTWRARPLQKEVPVNSLVVVTITIDLPYLISFGDGGGEFERDSSNTSASNIYFLEGTYLITGESKSGFYVRPSSTACFVGKKIMLPLLLSISISFFFLLRHHHH